MHLSPTHLPSMGPNTHTAAHRICSQDTLSKEKKSLPLHSIISSVPVLIQSVMIDIRIKQDLCHHIGEGKYKVGFEQ